MWRGLSDVLGAFGLHLRFDNKSGKDCNAQKTGVGWVALLLSTSASGKLLELTGFAGLHYHIKEKPFGRFQTIVIICLQKVHISIVLCKNILGF